LSIIQKEKKEPYGEMGLLFLAIQFERQMVSLLYFDVNPLGSCLDYNQEIFDMT